MEWYWVVILCFIAACVGLLIGYMCRLAGRADEWAGLKASEGQPNHTDKEPVLLLQPTIDRMRNYSESRIATVAVVPYDQTSSITKSAINLISMFYKDKRKKFRWKNYYKALKIIGRVTSGKRSEGSKHSKNN